MPNMYSKIVESNYSELVFTPASILELLSKIEEFEDLDLGLTEGLDGSLMLQVGDSVYRIDPEENITEIDVAEDVVDEISNINENTYSELINSGMAIDDQVVETGIIKETLKTLLIGGIVRLGKDYLTH